MSVRIIPWPLIPRWIGALGLLLVSHPLWGDDAKTPGAAVPKVDFARDVQPIFKTRCFSCHDGVKQRGGFRLDVKSAAMKGGESFSPDIRPGQSAESPLIRLVEGLEPGMLMPPEGAKLTAAQIATLRAWIDQGASWPEDSSSVDDTKAHWSFRAVVRPEIPVATSRERVRNPIDSFIAATLTGQRPNGGSLSPEADRVTLIRRLSFDLHGLPPSPDDVAEFAADAHPEAYERLVDRLLASPHFGERWARHWLDVVRFAESDGFETNQPRPNAWPYRDYIIRSLNEDKPYEQFVRDQLAGDAFNTDEATGFIVGGAYDRVRSPDPVLTAQQRADELHDMVSTTGSAFLGLTVGCARCHNHKFDPISQTDYYGMKAVFAGVQHGERPLKPADFDVRERSLKKLKDELATVEQSLRLFEPLAYVPRSLNNANVTTHQTTVLLDDDSPLAMDGRAGVTQLIPRIGLEPHRQGTGRGQAGDPGDLRRLPDLGRNYSYWKDVAGKDVFSWSPTVTGTYRVWFSWGCGWQTHARDARYILDADGDLATTNDQQEIAVVDQQRFADGTGGNEQQPLWSGFYDAGQREFGPKTRLILRGGKTDAYVTADLICLQQVTDGANEQSDSPRLRASVHRKTNVERFTPILARYVRFTVDETNNGAQPCLDELEVMTTGVTSRNVALEATATSSSNLPGYEIHQLKHVNDGRYGNSASWISNEAGRGWIQLELPQPVEIDRILWSRDRLENGSFTDRIPTKYRIEAGLHPETLSVVATSDDRVPFERNVTALPTRSGLDEHSQLEASQLAQRQVAINQSIRELTSTAQAYAGRFTTPEPTNRFHRGDPMQPREPTAPSGLASFGSELKLPLDAPEAMRRQKLADWITSRDHPLTSRVLVNRYWHSHFGQGLVTTTSDFGRNGARPSHPELLDWLAAELFPLSSRESDKPVPSSPKHLHRLIVTSSTYRQSSAAREEWLTLDAGSRLLWRYPPRRLEAESLRDAILMVCGNMDDRMGGPGFDLFEPNTNYVKVYNSRREFGPLEWRRMVYQSKPRMQLDETFGQFDCPDAGQIAPTRTSSITALQALNLLNSSFILQQSSIFASRIERDAGSDSLAQTRRAFELAYLRPPSPEELSAATQLIEQHGLIALCRAILNSNEFLFVY